MALCFPALGSGAHVDSIYLQAQGRHAPWWGILQREHRSIEDNARALADGRMPWWADIEAQPPRHVRPLGSALHYADFHLLPYSPWWWHLHSVLWYGLLAASAALLYRRLMGPTWVAGLAAIMFAIDDGHGLLAGHIASRPAVASAVMAVWAAICHDRFARGGSRLAQVGSVLCFAGAMGTYELSIGVVGLLGGHALWFDKRAVRERVSGLLPFLLVVVVWLAVFELQGAGGRASGLYTDPLEQPLAFVRQIVHVAPVYAASLLLWFPSEVWLYFGDANRLWATVVLGALAVVVIAALARRLRVRVAGPWALAALAGLLPAFGAFANDRMLLMASLGTAPLIALLLESLWRDGVGLGSRGLGGLLVCCHLVVAPALLPVRAQTMATTYGRVHQRGMASLPADAALAQQTLVMVNTPDRLVSIAINLRGSLGGVVPRKTLLLGATPGRVRVDQVDERTLILEADEGYLADPFSQSARSPGKPLAAGQKIEWGGVLVTVEALTADLRPRRVRFAFPETLAHEDLRWTVWAGDRFIRWRPPGVGKSTELSPTDFWQLLLGW